MRNLLLAVLPLLLASPCAGQEKQAAPQKPPGPTNLRAAAGITLGKETTRITAPLNPDGTVDYLQALNDMVSKGVAPDNNAAVTFWQALGPGTSFLEDVEVAKRLRLIFAARR